MEKELLKKLQKKEQSILDEVVKICESNNLNYYLVGGTLLGAIRHKGFIPWDDDIDIGMPRSDYEKFKKICRHELPNELFLQDGKTDKNYYLPFMKVRKNNTIFEEDYTINIEMHKGIYIDIFPLDNAKKQISVLQKIQYMIYKKVYAMIWYKVVISSKLEKSFKEMIILGGLKLITIEFLKGLQNYIMALNKNKKSLFYVNMGSQYGIKKQTMPKDKYFPPSKVEFEGKLYNAPKDYDYVLSKIFGDYMKLPPEDKRVTHNPVRLKFEGEDEIIF